MGFLCVLLDRKDNILLRMQLKLLKVLTRLYRINKKIREGVSFSDWYICKCTYGWKSNGIIHFISKFQKRIQTQLKILLQKVNIIDKLHLECGENIYVLIFVFLLETLYSSLIIQVIVTTLIITQVLVTDNRFIHLIVLPSFFYVVY